LQKFVLNKEIKTAKTSQEIEKEFIDGLKSNTGNDLKGWLTTLKGNGIEKRNDIIKWLKEQNNFGHMNASLLAGIYFNNGNPVYGSEQNLLDSQFEKYQEMRPLFEHLQKKISEWDNSVEFIIKKTYVSITKKREFAAINIKKGELRMGMDLGNVPFEGIVVKSKLTGPMQRISHMVTIKNQSDISEKMFQLLDTANKRVNQ
jgi:predicted transport protein